MDFANSTAIIADDVTDAASSTTFPSDWVAWGATDGSLLSFTQGDRQHTGTGTLTITGASGTSTIPKPKHFSNNK